MAQYQYDVGVIGSGPAGLAAAFAAKALGKSVVIIEQYLWGGTCPNYGCDPKKYCFLPLKVLGVNPPCKDVAYKDTQKLIGQT